MIGEGFDQTANISTGHYLLILVSVRKSILCNCTEHSFVTVPSQKVCPFSPFIFLGKGLGLWLTFERQLCRHDWQLGGFGAGCVLSMAHWHQSSVPARRAGRKLGCRVSEVGSGEGGDALGTRGVRNDV